MPVFFSTIIIILILLKPKTVQSTAELELNDFTHSNPFDSTRIGGLRRKSGWKNGTRRPSNVDEVQRPIQLNPLPLPTSNSKNQMLSRDMNEQQQQQLMMSNKRPLDGAAYFDHLMKAEIAAKNDSYEPVDMARKRARTTSLGGKIEQKSPLVPIGMQKLLMAETNKKRPRMQSEDADAENSEKKRHKGVYDAGIPNMEQEDDTPITQEELDQLHRVEPMLETPELQFAVHAVEMQAQMLINALASHAKPVNTAEEVQLQNNTNNTNAVQQPAQPNVQAVQEKAAEEQLQEYHGDDPNAFKFNAKLPPTIRPRGSIEVELMNQSTTPPVQSASMQDAWSEKLNSTGSTGRSPMEIDAKKFASKTANKRIKSAFGTLSRKLVKNPMSDKKMNLEMARTNRAVMEMITKGHINFSKLFQLSQSNTFRKKLTLLMETWQAHINGPSRCDNHVKLSQFKSMSKISDMFFSTDEQQLGQGGTARVYRANSEYLERCIAIKEVPLKRMGQDLAQQYRKEMAILAILSNENFKLSIRMYRGYEKNSELTMALELGVMSLHRLWMTYLIQVENSYKRLEQELLKSPAERWKMEMHYVQRKTSLTRLMEHLLKEMAEAVAEFHQIGMHLDLKLGNFVAVQDEVRGTSFSTGNGQQIKLRTKLIDFGGAVLINPDRYRSDLPEDVRRKMVIDTTKCVRHNVGFGTFNHMAPEQIECSDGVYLVSTKSDIWAMGTVLYEMFLGDTPNALLCQRSHPKWIQWKKSKIMKQVDYRRCLLAVTKSQMGVDKIEYPSTARMAQDGSQHLWNIVKASLQFDARLRPTARGILAYLRQECRLQINRMGDLMGYHNDVPWKRCELDPKEGQVISRDPNRFNPY